MEAERHVDQPHDQQNTPDKKGTKGWLYAFTIIVAMSVVGVSVYYLQQQHIDQLSSQNATLQQPAGGQTKQPAKPATATISEQQLPFTVTYPADWAVTYDKPIHVGDLPQPSYTIGFLAPGTIVHEEPIGSTSTFKGARMYLRVEPTDETVEAYISGLPSYLKIITKDTQVGGVTAKQYTSGYESERALYTVFVKSGKLYNLTFVASDGLDKSVYYSAYTSLLDSFKFK